MNLHLITTPLALLLGFLISFSAACAQDYDNKIHFGAKLGMNLSNFTKEVGPFDRNSPNNVFPDWLNMGHLSGQFGFTADYRINDKLSIATEILANARGNSYHIKRDDIVLVDTAGNESPGYDNYDFNIYYLEMPLVVKYQLPIRSKQLNYGVYAGFSPAMKLYAYTHYYYYTVDDNGEVGNASQDQPLPNVRNFTLNTMFGFYYGEKASTINMPFTSYVDLRFENAHFPVFNTARQNGDNFNTGLWTVTLSVGIRF